MQPHFQFDKIHITTDAPASEPHAPASLSTRVWINDRLPVEEDYTLDIQSFFESLDLVQGKVSFTGGCGIPECCAVGFRTHAGINSWHLGDFAFSWTSVYEIANQLISLIESLPTSSKEYAHFSPLLKEFSRKRDSIKPRLSKGSP